MTSRIPWNRLIAPGQAALCAIVLCALTLLSGCASNSKAPIATAEMQQVSVTALLARAPEFDGQPVRVVGIARFESAPDGQSAVYASASDERRSTPSHIAIASLSPALSAAPGALEKMSGKSVAIEGTFRARPLNKIPERPGSVSVCVGDCQTSGVLEGVTRVSLLEQ